MGWFDFSPAMSRIVGAKSMFTTGLGLTVPFFIPGPLKNKRLNWALQEQILMEYAMLVSVSQSPYLFNAMSHSNILVCLLGYF